MNFLPFLLSIAGVAFAVDCPDFAEYALVPHGTPSSGPLALPYMRPSPACRTFNSSAVEVGQPYSVPFESDLSLASDTGHECAHEGS